MKKKEKNSKIQQNPDEQIREKGQGRGLNSLATRAPSPPRLLERSSGPTVFWHSSLLDLDNFFKPILFSASIFG